MMSTDDNVDDKLAAMTLNDRYKLRPRFVEESGIEPAAPASVEYVQNELTLDGQHTVKLKPQCLDFEREFENSANSH